MFEEGTHSIAQSLTLRPLSVAIPFHCRNSSLVSGGLSKTKLTH